MDRKNERSFPETILSYQVLSKYLQAKIIITVWINEHRMKTENESYFQLIRAIKLVLISSNNNKIGYELLILPAARDMWLALRRNFLMLPVICLHSLSISVFIAFLPNEGQRGSCLTSKRWVWRLAPSVGVAVLRKHHRARSLSSVRYLWSIFMAEFCYKIVEHLLE